MSSKQSDNPDQSSEHGPYSISLFRERVAKIEDSPLLQPLKLEFESQTAQLGRATKQNIPTISSSFRRWWSELLACGLSVCVLLILVLTLRPYQGDPASSWPLKITINTFVSICTLTIKALSGMVLSNGIGQLKWVWYRQARPLVHLQSYDSASRGVVGSIGLLWTHRGRQMIPTIGALLMILLTLADPFGQLLVRLEDCTVIDPSIRSSIAATHHADILDNKDLFSATLLEDADDHVADDAQALMIIGLLNETLIPSVTFECPTGNCSFPQPYHSSGYCSRCTDFSKQVTLIDNDTWTWEAADISLSSHIHGLGTFVNVTAITMDNSTSVASGIASIRIMGSQLQQCENNSTTPWRCQGFGAATCEIYACVVSYSGNVNVGTLNETITDTSAVWSPPEQKTFQKFLGSVDVACLNTSELNALQQAGFDIDSGTGWLAYNVSVVSYGVGATLYEKKFRPECLYVTDLLQLGSIYQAFENLLSKTPVSTQREALGFGIYGPIQWQALWNQGNMDFVNIQQAFDGLAKGMTYYARNNPIDAVEGVIGENYWNGTSYRDTSCIQIQLKWIAYLSTTMFGVIIFLLGTMVMARLTLKDTEQDYKTSILPLMFHGVEFTNSERSLKALKLTKEITKEARSIYVAFEETEKGWQFIEKKVRDVSFLEHIYLQSFDI